MEKSILNKSQSRYTCYDFLRVILVILVVLGHGTYYNIVTPFGGIHYSAMMNKALISDTLFHEHVNNLKEFIYTFHMPAFVALSGSLFALKNEKNIDSFIKKKAKRLLIPFIVVWLFWNFPLKYITGYYKGIGICKIFLQIIFPSSVYLWYLECLFIVSILMFLIKNLNFRMQFTIVIGTYILGIILYNNEYMMHFLGDPLYYLVWYWFGYKIEDIIRWMKEKKIWNDITILIVFLVICSSYILNPKIKNDFFDLATMHFLFPGLMIVVLNYVVRRVKLKNGYLYTMSSYGFGIYLYSDPLNYIILYLTFKWFGINVFGSEIGSAIIYFCRIFLTPVVAITITCILKKNNMKYLY